MFLNNFLVSLKLVLLQFIVPSLAIETINVVADVLFIVIPVFIAGYLLLKLVMEFIERRKEKKEFEEFDQEKAISEEQNAELQTE
ncbi:MAG: hypothetical protein GF308_07570 [Candidatus Heimdallarchaeota archaeon]|nr:hypothetical protein [Candidatus Heimdallarchaeota archaeon]